jgi:hypothetical protein
LVFSAGLVFLLRLAGALVALPGFILTTRLPGRPTGVVRFEPIASADIEDVVKWYAPTMQRYLTGPLPGDRRRRASKGS